ncbi:MAG: Thioredoxin-1 [Alphaproteobacteria bacterium MarineAlpha5_Bin9]|nr:MAG: Thioredoxin-1 [Alphaproteobacteria bacterium MarineAlpha5_Bin9]|tara:strand:- start:6748 stop:7086 length:339 start_codon:yes stop_codon:yes gene_type:complete
MNNITDDNITHTSDANFDKDVLNSKSLTLIDFWAEWCGPCKQIAPILKEIADEKKGLLKIVKINIDENQMIPQKYNVRGIPTLMLFKEGKLIDSKVGSLPKSSLSQWLEEYL